MVTSQISANHTDPSVPNILDGGYGIFARDLRISADRDASCPPAAFEAALKKSEETAAKRPEADPGLRPPECSKRRDETGAPDLVDAGGAADATASAPAGGEGLPHSVEGDLASIREEDPCMTASDQPQIPEQPSLGAGIDGDRPVFPPPEQPSDGGAPQMDGVGMSDGETLLTACTDKSDGLLLSDVTEPTGGQDDGDVSRPASGPTGGETAAPKSAAAPLEQGETQEPAVEEPPSEAPMVDAADGAADGADGDGSPASSHGQAAFQDKDSRARKPETAFEFSNGAVDDDGPQDTSGPASTLQALHRAAAEDINRPPVSAVRAVSLNTDGQGTAFGGAFASASSAEAGPPSSAPPTSAVEMPAPGASDRMLPSTIADQIVSRAVLSLKEGQNEIRIRLRPDFLGRLDMRIMAGERGVSVEMLTEMPLVKEMIQTHLDQLRANFSEQGMEIDKFDVVVDQEQHRFGGHHLRQSHGRQNGLRANRQPSGPDIGDEPDGTGVMPNSPSSSNRIDFFA